MARWTASAKWAGGPALDGQRAMPLALRLSEGLGLARRTTTLFKWLCSLIRSWAILIARDGNNLAVTVFAKNLVCVGSGAAPLFK